MLHAICTFYIGVRIYEQVFGWYAGLDSFAPEFTTYWMTILYIEEPVELISFLALVGWMWKTRDKDMANVQPREEMRRMFNLMAGFSSMASRSTGAPATSRSRTAPGI